MVMQLSPEVRGSLRKVGYEMVELRGFDTHELPLYTHKRLTDKEPGDIAIRMRVGNLKQLDKAEVGYLMAKGNKGFFTWPPEECFNHTFEDVVYEEDRLGGRRKVVRGESYKGCKWCRAAQLTQGSEGEVEATGEIEPPADLTPPMATCSQCNFTTDKGDWSLQVHIARAHSSTPANNRSTRRKKGAGRRNK